MDKDFENENFNKDQDDYEENFYKGYYKEEVEEEIPTQESNFDNINYLDKFEREKKRKKKNFKGSFTSYLLIVLVTAILSSFLGGVSAYYLMPKLLGEEVAAEETSQGININVKGEENLVPAVVKKVEHAVVGITTVETVQDFLFSIPVEGTGSGVIVDSRGFILTNAHVVGGDNTQSINVLLEDGERLPAKVIWRSDTKDLAMVKVDRTGLVAAELGNSKDLVVGDTAIAIGNPLTHELKGTVTKGIISGLDRTVRISDSVIMDNLIQTDASINPGNSGGPLLNDKGQVIGINTAKIKTSEGLGFAIPIDDIKPLVAKIIEEGEYSTVYLGVHLIPVEDYERSWGVELPYESGLILILVAEDSPAANAGLIIGDVITQVDGKDVNSKDELMMHLYKYKLGDKAEFTIIRGNEELKIEIEFTELTS